MNTKKKYEVFVSQVGGLRGRVTVSVGGVVVGTTTLIPSSLGMDELQAFAAFIEESLNKNQEKGSSWAK